MITLIPAYGRDYKTARAAREAFARGDDFIIADNFHPYDGKPINLADMRRDPGDGFVLLRFNQLRKISRVPLDKPEPPAKRAKPKAPPAKRVFVVTLALPIEQRAAIISALLGAGYLAEPASGGCRFRVTEIEPPASRRMSEIQNCSAVITALRSVQRKAWPSRGSDGKLCHVPERAALVSWRNVYRFGVQGVKRSFAGPAY